MESAQGPKIEKGEKNALGMASEENINVLARQTTGMAIDMTVKELKVP